MPRDSWPGPIRIFRADTPHDVISAALVARQRPRGRDILVVTTEYGRAVQSDYLASMLSIATVHRWETIVDITGLPFMKDVVFNPQGCSRLARGKVLTESVQWLRRRLAAALGTVESRLGGGVDEVYLNCQHHPDVQLFYRLFPSAMKMYYPHGFDCIHLYEMKEIGRHLGSRYRVKFLFQLIFDCYRRLRHGLDGVPVRKVTVDMAYTFNLNPTWGCPVKSLAHGLNREVMATIFSLLPEDAIAYYGGLASQVLGIGTLVLVHASESDSSYSSTKELEGTVDLVQRVVEKEGSQSILIKPHPRSSRDWIDKVVEHLRVRLPENRILVIDQFYHYPVEVILSPFKILACVGVCSTALRTLKRIYGIRAYFAPEFLIDLMNFSEQSQTAHREWIEDVEKDLIGV